MYCPPTVGRLNETATKPTPGAAAQVGVAGHAVTGSNLARYIARHGYAVALYNRTTARTDALVEQNGSEDTFVPAAWPPAR